MSDKKSVALVRRAKKAEAAATTPAQEALQVTWTLKGHLKNAQISYLRVGVLLAQVRDEQMFAVLHHRDMENYAAERLHLGRSSLYRYLQVHDWIAKFHAAWLQPKPSGFIPDLAQAADLIWLEKELARTNLDARTRAALEALRKQALAGTLQHANLAPYRKHHSGDVSLKAFLSRLRILRMRGSQLTTMPAEAISDLDAAIEAIAHVVTLARLGNDPAPAGKVWADVKKSARKSRARKTV